jgi:hypothetical protein
VLGGGRLDLVRPGQLAWAEQAKGRAWVRGAWGRVGEAHTCARLIQRAGRVAHSLSISRSVTAETCVVGTTVVRPGWPWLEGEAKVADDWCANGKTDYRVKVGMDDQRDRAESGKRVWTATQSSGYNQQQGGGGGG